MRARVTKIHDKVSNNCEAIPQAERLSLVSTLEDIKIDLKDLDSSIGQTLWESTPSDTAMEAEWTTCESYQKKITNAILILKQIV